MKLPEQCLNCSRPCEYSLNKFTNTLTADCECGAHITLRLEVKMPMIIYTCKHCHIELFSSFTHETKEFHMNYCVNCARKLEEEAWKYRELCR